MAQTNKFRNVILCEDIRDEVGNKKSLMGVMGGDVLVSSFPATIKVAFYAEYISDADDLEHASIDIRIMQDDVEMAKGKIEAKLQPGQPATLILPTGLANFEHEGTIRLFASVNGGPEQEVLRKKFVKATS